MAKNTEHYGLVKPAQSNFYNVEDFNGNADIIDSALQGKVDKVSGKGLSANDYTTAEKAKVAAAVPNTRKVNGKALSADITLNAADVGADVSGAAGAVQTALNTHTADKTNPHEVTREQIGAAAETHVHATSDITGVLPVSRGGTGVASFNGSRVLIGGSDPYGIGQVAFPSGTQKHFLTQSTTATPTWMTPAGAANLILGGGGIQSGSWIPTLRGATNNGTVHVASGYDCKYFKMGKLLYLTFSITIQSVGSATGLFVISGLPFSVTPSGEFPTGTYWHRLKATYTMLYATRYTATSFALRGTRNSSNSSVSNLEVADLNDGGAASGTILIGTAVLLADE